MNTAKTSLPSKANEDLLSNNFAKAVKLYVKELTEKPALSDILEFNLCLARRRYRGSRLKEQMRIGIIGWNEGQKAGNRIVTLASLAAEIGTPMIIEAVSTLAAQSSRIPNLESGFSSVIHNFDDEQNFPEQALNLVLENPFDTVILSKPLMPNILFGMLYKLVWRSQVILDIDDDELRSAGCEAPQTLETLIEKLGGHLSWHGIDQREWTQTAASLTDLFGEKTTSNNLLSNRYGGRVIPTTFNRDDTSGSKERKSTDLESADIYGDKPGISIFLSQVDDRLISHLATAISGLSNDKICFVIVGTVSANQKEELNALSDSDIIYLPEDPHANMADIIQGSAACLFLESSQSSKTSATIPENLISALASNRVTFAQPTAALAELIDAQALIPVTTETLGATLSKFLSDKVSFLRIAENGFSYYNENFSVRVARDRFSGIIKPKPLKSPSMELFDEPRLLKTFEDLGGWQMFTPKRPPFRRIGVSSVNSDVAKVIESPSLVPAASTRADFEVALVVHVFHLDTLPDLTRYAANFPEGADQFVTCPDTFDERQITIIRNAFPEAQIVKVPNSGQDVGALFSLTERVDLNCYEVICKIHSKKGEKEPKRWRQALLQGVLGSKVQVKSILEAFRTDPKLMLAGPRQLYLHGPSNLWKNAETLERVFGDLIASFDYKNESWGFFAGTCFWIRGSALNDIRRRTTQNLFSNGPYVNDGTVAHCTERLFGMIASIRDGRILLCDVEKPDRIEIIESEFPSSEPRAKVDILSLLERINLPGSTVDPSKLRGGINNASGANLRGWLALPGDYEPRRGYLKIGDHIIHFDANISRGDLKSHKVNDGKHGFQVQVPLKILDGVEREVVLIDSVSGHEVARKKFRWEKVSRNYSDFQGFLKSSLTQPEVHSPFPEADKRAFSVMEGIANSLSKRANSLPHKPLVTVVMPMYNRESIVVSAIESVLSQTYSNFELIIVDDGSTDTSRDVVRRIQDPRIRLIELSENQGQTVARNTALKASEGSIVSFLDSDNRWDERYLSAVVGALDKLPEADMIYTGTMLYFGEASEPHAIRYCHHNRALLSNKNFIDTNIIVMRREFVERLGGFDEDLRRFPDYDLSLRATECGKVFSVPVLLCHYYYGNTDNAMTDDEHYASNLSVISENHKKRVSERLAERNQEDLVKPVSIIIPNWESLDDIRECIDALCARDWKGMLDIIVVDNDSHVDVKSYLRSQHDADRIHFIPLDANYGFTYAVNIGIECARPDSDIVLLNNDAIAQPGAIQALQAACFDRDDAGMIVPRQILPAGTKTMKTHVPYSRSTEDCDVNISAHHMNVANVPVFHDGGALELTYAPFFAVYIRREVIDEIGLLDAEYGRHYRSDRVYCDMMRNLTDYRMYYTPDSHFIHKLQKATDHLREVGKTDNSFDLMFKRNQWDKDTANRLGFRTAPWDRF